MDHLKYILKLHAYIATCVCVYVIARFVPIMFLRFPIIPSKSSNLLYHIWSSTSYYYSSNFYCVMSTMYMVSTIYWRTRCLQCWLFHILHCYFNFHHHHIVIILLHLAIVALYYAHAECPIIQIKIVTCYSQNYAGIAIRLKSSNCIK